MSHTPSAFVIVKGAARFSRVALLVAFAAAAVPLAYGAVLLALGTEGAAGYVAGAARSFLLIAGTAIAGWVVTGWFLEAVKRETAALRKARTS